MTEKTQNHGIVVLKLITGELLFSHKVAIVQSDVADGQMVEISDPMIFLKDAFVSEDGEEVTSGWRMEDFLEWSDDKVLRIPPQAIVFSHSSVSREAAQAYWEETSSIQFIPEGSEEREDNVVSFFRPTSKSN